MHRALAITDILHQIVDQAGHNTRMLLALALACRAFSEPALDTLWSTQVGLGYLVECLPSDLWTVSKGTQGTLVSQAPVL